MTLTSYGPAAFHQTTFSQHQYHNGSLESLSEEGVSALSGLLSAARSLLLTLKSESLSVNFLFSKMGICYPSSDWQLLQVQHDC